MYISPYPSWINPMRDVRVTVQFLPFAYSRIKRTLLSSSAPDVQCGLFQGFAVSHASVSELLQQGEKSDHHVASSCFFFKVSSVAGGSLHSLIWVITAMHPGSWWKLCCNYILLGEQSSRRDSSLLPVTLVFRFATVPPSVTVFTVQTLKMFVKVCSLVFFFIFFFLVFL